MAKRKGKGPLPLTKPVLDASNAERFEARRTTVARREAVKRDEFYAQEYANKVIAAHDKYVSSMQKIHAQLKTAQEGLAKIDEKGMADDLIAAIEKIEKLQRMEISTTSAFTTELAGYDSERLDSIRKSGNKNYIFAAESIDMRIKAENTNVKKSLAELDAQYNELEATIATTKDYTPTDEDVLEVRRKQQVILEQKQAKMLGYAKFLEESAQRRDAVIDPTRRRREDEAALEQEFVDGKRPASAETPEETKAKADVIATSFDIAEKKSNPKWEAFKSAPVVSHLIAAGSFISSKVSKKLEPFATDIKAAYAVMKERKQMRKVEQDLARLDELTGKTGEESHVSRFKAMLAEKGSVAESVTETKETSKPEFVPVSEPEETKAEVAETEAPVAEASITEEAPAESEHDRRVRRASNIAVLQALDGNGLRKMINDYYWSDVSATQDVLKDLETSDNAMADLTQYTERLKNVISHFPNEKLREALTARVDGAMTNIYQAKTEAERKVSAAEARVRDSQEFLASLDGEPGSQPEEEVETGI